MVIHVTDAREADPGARGDVLLVDVETGDGREVTLTPALVAKFRDAHAHWRHEVEGFCKARRVAYAPADVEGALRRPGAQPLPPRARGKGANRGAGVRALALSDTGGCRTGTHGSAVESSSCSTAPDSVRGATLLLPGVRANARTPGDAATSSPQESRADGVARPRPRAARLGGRGSPAPPWWASTSSASAGAGCSSPSRRSGPACSTSAPPRSSSSACAGCSRSSSSSYCSRCWWWRWATRGPPGRRGAGAPRCCSSTPAPA
jgi:hypothetical protein